MIGEIIIGGVYLPSLLVMAGVALLLSIITGRALMMLGAYRWVAFRPLADLTLFFLFLGALVALTQQYGIRP